MDDYRLIQILNALRELGEDSAISKGIKIHINTTIKILETANCEHCLKVSRAINEIEPLSTEISVEAFTRTQLFNIVSMLEALK